MLDLPPPPADPDADIDPRHTSTHPGDDDAGGEGGGGGAGGGGGGGGGASDRSSHVRLAVSCARRPPWPIFVNTSYNAEEADDDCDTVRAMGLRRRRRPLVRDAIRGGAAGGALGRAGPVEGLLLEAQLEVEHAPGLVAVVWGDEPNPFRSRLSRPSTHAGERLFENHSWMCFA